MREPSKDFTITHVGETELATPMKLLFLKTKGVEFEFQADDGTEYAPKESFEVTFPHDFYLCEYPCTQEFWAAVVKEAGSKELKENPSRFKGNRRPVENVSWNNIQLFFGDLNELMNKNKLAIEIGDKTTNNFKELSLDEDFKFQLPAEVEWEYAAAAGQKTVYSGSNVLEDVGWYDRNSGGQTMPVGLKQPNDFGFYDMNGNVWEWCRNNYETPKSLEVGRGDDSRSLRGGGWFTYAPYCRLRNRGVNRPGLRNHGYGFRFGFFLVPTVEK